MLKLTVSENIEPSPKNNLLRELNFAFAKETSEEILGMVTDDIVWEIVGHNTIQGRKAFKSTLAQIQGSQVQELVIDKIISQGNIGAANGLIVLNGGATFGFCDMYEFDELDDLRVSLIRSFNIEIKKE